METIFESQYTCTQAFCREFWGYNYFKRIIALHIILALYFVLNLVQIIVYGVGQNGAASFGVWFPLFLWGLLLLNYFRLSNLQYKRTLEVNNGQPLDMISSLSADEVKVEGITTESKTKVAISQIKRVIRTKNYFLLVTRSKLVFTFKNDGFTKGTPEGFLAFLSSKGVK